jgi:hypothetical protein
VVALFNKPEMEPGDNHLQPTMEAPREQMELLNSQGVRIRLRLDGLEHAGYRLVRYRFDQEQSHAYARWLDMGSPGDPTTAQYLELASAMEPAVAEIRDLKAVDRTISLESGFPSSGISFLVLAAPRDHPEMVTGLQTKKYTGLNGEEMVMLLWNRAGNGGVLTYEVQAMGPGDRSFRKVNPATLMDSGFACPLEDATGYRFRVRAVDYWNRKGKFSRVITME